MVAGVLVVVPAAPASRTAEASRARASWVEVALPTAKRRTVVALTCLPSSVSALKVRRAR